MPAGSRVRPTSDKVKQALFNILGERLRTRCSWISLPAPAGIGIEALSRGADRSSSLTIPGNRCRPIKHNLEQAGFGDRAQIVASRAESFLKKAGEQFDIIFLDPPYSLEQAAAAASC